MQHRDSPSRRPLGRKTMAQALADQLTEEIVRGSLRPGDALPTEPELAAEFQVSRSVVRDATRMLAARGLISVQHGRGAFVTESQLDAFSEALLLALRREGASVHEVEEFFERFWPEAVALAADRATDEEIQRVDERARRYETVFADLVRSSSDEETGDVGPQGQAAIREAFGLFMDAVIAATHNALFALLSKPVLSLRSLRRWDTSDMGVDEVIETETSAFRAVVEALRTRNPGAAREAIQRWFVLPPEAVQAMKETPVGEVVDIPAAFGSLGHHSEKEPH